MIFLQAVKLDNEKVVNLADSAKVGITQFAESLINNPNETIKGIADDALGFGLKLVAAILIYIIGNWLIKRIKRTINRIFARRNSEKTLATFISSLVTIVLTVVLLLTVMGTLGINTTSLAALLAAGSVAIAMSLSTTAQNFAGGLMILAFKPFKAGDTIEAQGVLGVVTKVTIVNTSVLTMDKKATVIIPNGSLFNGIIHNCSDNPYRRISWTVSVDYNSNVHKVKAALRQIAKADPRILDKETPGLEDVFVTIENLGSSSVDYLVRAWAKSEDYWSVYYDFNNRVYDQLPCDDIHFPYPQLDVHLKKGD